MLAQLEWNESTDHLTFKYIIFHSLCLSLCQEYESGSHELNVCYALCWVNIWNVVTCNLGANVIIYGGMSCRYGGIVIDTNWDF